MDKAFKFFDIYGSNFNLRINNQSKFKSVTGGLLSIITMGVFFFCCYYFGRDFYMGLNPYVRLEEGIYDSSERIMLRDSAYEEKQIVLAVQKKFDSKAKPFLSVKEGNKYEGKNYLDPCDLKYLIGNKIIKSEEDANLNSFEYYCFIANDYNLTVATMDQTHYSPLVLNFDNCKVIPQEIMEKNNWTCNTDPDVIVSDAYLIIYIEKVGFSPQEKNAFVKKFSVIDGRYTSDQLSFVDIYLSKYTLHDDIGWILPDLRNNTVLNVHSIKKDFISLPGSSKLPKLMISLQLTDEFRIYHRTYSKLQNALAEIGGFMKLIFTVLNSFNFLIRSYLIDIYMLTRQFSEEDEGKETPDNSQGNILADNSDAVTKRVYNNFVSELNTVKKENNALAINVNNSSNTKTVPFPNGETKFELLVKPKKAPINFCSYVQVLLYMMTNKKIDTNTVQGKNTEKLKKKIQIIDKLRDYDYIITKIQEMENFRSMVLNEYQIMAMSYLKKDDKVIEQLTNTKYHLILKEEEKTQHVINYFVNLLKENPLVGNDELIFRKLDKGLQEKILLNLMKNQN